MDLRLVRPDSSYYSSYLAAAREFTARGEYDGHRIYDPNEIERNFAGLVQWFHEQETVQARIFTPGYAPTPITWWWLIDGNEFIGSINIRHTRDDPYIAEVIGTIGYDIRPERRQQGYGTALLRLGLEKARMLGLQQVVLVCREHNIGSRRVIEANGGVCTKVVSIPHAKGIPVRWLHYQIQFALVKERAQ